MNFFFSPAGKEYLDIVHEKAAASNFDTAKTALACSKNPRLAALAPETGNHFHLAVEIIIARHKLAKEHGTNSWHSSGFFTKQSLEQSSRPLVAQLHARKFKGCNHVLEIATGLGFDTAEIARNAKQITTIEINPVTAEFAQKNFELQGLTNIRVITGDFNSIKCDLTFSDYDGLWADPSRKGSAGEKIHNPDDYQPSLPSIMELEIKGISGIKLSPGVDLLAELLANSRKNWVREWVGFNDECVDQVLWQGTDLVDGTVAIVNSKAAATQNENLYLPQSINAEIENTAELVPADELKNRITDGEAAYLVEPHAALIRSGRLAEYYFDNAIYLIDSKIAYGITFKPQIGNIFIDSYPLIDVLPYHSKHVNQKLQELSWGEQTVIKKRGFPKEPEQVRKELKFIKQSKLKGVIILTRIGNRHYAFICQEKTN